MSQTKLVALKCWRVHALRPDTDRTFCGLSTTHNDLKPVGWWASTAGGACRNCACAVYPYLMSVDPTYRAMRENVA